MAAFNPYLIDEIVTEAKMKSNFFGLITETEAHRSELYGYEVTMSGRLVTPELHPQMPRAEEYGQTVSSAATAEMSSMPPSFD